MITVHHLENSRSQRVLWMLEELGLDYEVKLYKREPSMQAPASLRDVHPLGKSPVITDGDRTIAESGAILEYLIETHGSGRLVAAKGTQAHLDYRYFMHYAEGSLMPYLLLRLIFSKVRAAPVPFFMKPVVKKIANKVSGDFVDPNLTRHLTFLNAHLAKHTWFAGDELTAADIQMSYPVEAAVERAKDLVPIDKLEAFVARIRERPAYKRAVEKAESPARRRSSPAID